MYNVCMYIHAVVVYSIAFGETTHNFLFVSYTHRNSKDLTFVLLYSKTKLQMNSINRILYESCPEVLTDKDLRTAEVQEELAKLYEPEASEPIEPDIAYDCLTNKQLNNVADKIYMLLNPQEAVCSTVDAPILDTDNVLFNVDDIDTDALANVLELHRQVIWHTRENLNELKDKVLFSQSKVPYKTRNVTNNERNHKVVEERAQRGDEQHNQCMWVLFDWPDDDSENEWLQDLNEDYEETQSYFKEQKVLDNSKYLLSNARASYNKRLSLRDSSIGHERIKNNNNMMEAFNDIRRYQRYIEWIEKANHDKKRKDIIRHRQKRYDYYLDKFVEYQQAELAKGNDPKRTREDVEAKYDFLTKKPIKPPYIPEWKKNKAA